MARSDLADHLAVVTGGSRGIGRHIARALHQAGARVVITGRKPETLDGSASRVGERCRGIVCDHRDGKAVTALAKTVLQEMGTPDILVNNAGVARGAPLVEMSEELWREVIDTNLTGVFLTTRAFLPAMIRRDRGDIFLIGSTSGLRGDPGGAAYSASKFGLRGFAQSLLYEVRNHNIRVMIMNPSSVNTREDEGAESGKGLFLHAADLASTVVHLACLPRRTLIREMEVFGTNP